MPIRSWNNVKVSLEIKTSCLIVTSKKFQKCSKNVPKIQFNTYATIKRILFYYFGSWWSIVGSDEYRFKNYKVNLHSHNVLLDAPLKRLWKLCIIKITVACMYNAYISSKLFLTLPVPAPRPPVRTHLTQVDEPHVNNGVSFNRQTKELLYSSPETYLRQKFCGSVFIFIFHPKPFTLCLFS